MIPTPIDNGNGAVVLEIHADGLSTVRVFGPYDTVDDAAEVAEEMDKSNDRLKVQNLHTTDVELRSCPRCGYQPQEGETLQPKHAGLHADQLLLRCPECSGLSWEDDWETKS